MEIEACRDYWILDFKNLFGTQMRIEGHKVGIGILRIEEKENFGMNIEGEESFERDKNKAKAG